MKRFVIALLGACLGVFSSMNGWAAPKPTEEPPVTRSLLRFAIDLHHTLPESGNLLLSPESIYTALAMTSAGASGATLEGMLKALRWDGKDTELHAAEQARLQELRVEDRGYSLKMANALWGEKGEPFLPAFLALVKDRYGSPLEEVDFKSHPEKALEAINHWASQMTNGKIERLVPAGAVTSATRLVLANAVYFKAPWVHPFQKGVTRDAEFFSDGTKAERVPTMRQQEVFPYYENGDVQIVQLPYKGRALAMVIVLPRDRRGLEKIEAKLDEAHWSSWTGDLKARSVALELPRFRFSSDFRLRQSLEKLGMEKAFSAGADFSRLSSQKGIAISEVLHQAYIDVNEEGTEAAAATAVMMFGAAHLGPPPVAMKVSHPFLFAIRDLRSGSVLFLGRVTKP